MEVMSSLILMVILDLLSLCMFVFSSTNDVIWLQVSENVELGKDDLKLQCNHRKINGFQIQEIILAKRKDGKNFTDIVSIKANEDHIFKIQWTNTEIRSRAHLNTTNIDEGKLAFWITSENVKNVDSGLYQCKISVLVNGSITYYKKSEKVEITDPKSTEISRKDDSSMEIGTGKVLAISFGIIVLLSVVLAATTLTIKRRIIPKRRQKWFDTNTKETIMIIEDK